ASSGTQQSPWKTITHGFANIQAGDALVLRGGTYYERLYCSAAGTADKPITIRSFPGELAIIDGSFREFFEKPGNAWEPFTGGSPGEYRSTATYRNVRNLHGRFGDSMVGLQIYYYIADLRGERYVGPGVWHNRATGRIHIRLQHYKAEGVVRGRSELARKLFPTPLHELQSYTGETDPRKLPLIISPFHSVPLVIDKAQHTRFQDLVVRGGAYDVVDIRHGEHLEFDNVVIYAGSYGIRARNTGPFKLHNSAVYGSVPPWSTRGESSLRERPWKSKGKNLTRLNTHSLIIPATSDEYSVYYFPYNHDWEISYSEFTDAHDGVYLGDIVNLKFHHNYVHNFQDDGLYLSSFRRLYNPQASSRLIYQNFIGACLITFAYGGDAKLSSEVHVYRNIISGAYTVSDHGSPPWEGMRWYHNTVLSDPKNLFNLRHMKTGQSWQVLNNLILAGNARPGKAGEGAAWAGNISGVKFDKPGNIQLTKESPALDAGEPIPDDWPDPLRKLEKGKPDAGALPLGANLKVGRNGRMVF
ncbi:MAG: right-handed parallel beta-helix repeat-containing protein, partial [Planctomycetota bacterium]|nr:right-handed parallel beta-helix repeat-containing protein [Planctomycetota bacterium]